MLHNLRRKLSINMGTNGAAPPGPPHTSNGIQQHIPSGADNVLIHPSTFSFESGSVASGSTSSPQTYESLGLAWSTSGERSLFSPSPLPLWLQEGVRLYYDCRSTEVGLQAVCVKPNQPSMSEERNGKKQNKQTSNRKFGRAVCAEQGFAYRTVVRKSLSAEE